jgi:hypothetical protein
VRNRKRLKKRKERARKKEREIREEEQGKLAGSRILFSAGKNELDLERKGGLKKGEVEGERRDALDRRIIFPIAART